MGVLEGKKGQLRYTHPTSKVVGQKQVKLKMFNPVYDTMPGEVRSVLLKDVPATVAVEIGKCPASRLPDCMIHYQNQIHAILTEDRQDEFEELVEEAQKGLSPDALESVRLAATRLLSELEPNTGGGR